jgi:hypothetical protein
LKFVMDKHNLLKGFAQSIDNNRLQYKMQLRG